jgi:hypothetical protein
MKIDLGLDTIIPKALISYAKVLLTSRKMKMIYNNTSKLDRL